MRSTKLDLSGKCGKAEHILLTLSAFPLMVTGGEELHSTKEAASKLGLSEQHIRYLSARGEIEGKPIGKAWIVLSLDYKGKRKPRRARGG